jgi:hypothetical protein
MSVVMKPVKLSIKTVIPIEADGLRRHLRAQRETSSLSR